MNNTVQPNTRQRSEPNHRFEELDQFHQDLQSPSLYRFYPDPCTDFCSLIGMIGYYYYCYLCLYMVNISINL